MNTSAQNTTKQKVVPDVQKNQLFDQNDQPPWYPSFLFSASPPTTPPSSPSSSEESSDSESSSESLEHPSRNLLEQQEFLEGSLVDDLNRPWLDLDVVLIP